MSHCRICDFSEVTNSQYIKGAIAKRTNRVIRFRGEELCLECVESIYDDIRDKETEIEQAEFPLEIQDLQETILEEIEQEIESS